MQRDKRGRFIKKATGGTQTTADGTQVTVKGKPYKIKPGAQQAFQEANTTGTYQNIMEWFEADQGADYLEPVSAGFDVYDNNKSKFKFDWLKASDFLEGIRAGVGIHVNKKMAERALEAEKPFLQDISEDYKPVYGNYRAKVQGEQAAAQFRNAAAVPLTSDGALQQQAMLDAQIKGQEYINQGNAADESTIRQTLDAAQAQRKANRENRQSIASANRQAMLMTAKNKADIENGLASANYSQIISPLMQGIEQRMRNDELKQKELRTKYQKSLIEQDVWNGTGMTLTPEQEQLRNAYLDGGIDAVNTLIAENSDRQAIWRELNRLMQREIIRRQAQLDGVTLDTSTSDYGMFTGDESLFNKKGGSIYKAKLVARSKDNDRAARSIESSKKLAARLLEKVLDSLYTYKDVELVGKSKKRKYQGGGGIPWVGFTPVFATSEHGEPVASKESKKDSDNNDLTSKDILALLKDMDGLPTDMSVIINALQNFQLNESMDPLGLDSSSNIASRYIKLIGQIKMANFHKDEYNAAFDQLKANGGLHEYAITSEGYLIGQNSEGDFKFFTPKDILDKKEEDSDYVLLTNSNLLYLRANSPEAAFNHKLTTVAQNGIGMQTVQSLINTAITSMGTVTSTQEGYISTAQGDLIQGLEDFKEAATVASGQFNGSVNDLYKYKYLTKSQAEKAQQALEYIYRTLPTNAKTLLKVKSDGTDKGAVNLIGTLIASKTSSEITFEPSLVGGVSHKSTGDSNKDNTDLKTSLPLNVLKGIGGVDSYVMLDRGDGIQMSVRGTAYNLIQATNGEAITHTSVETMLAHSGLQNIIEDNKRIQFGDQIISTEDLDNIAYNNTGIVRAILPINENQTVNLKLLEKYEKAEKEVELLANKTPENIKKIYESHGLLSLLNADGSYNQSKFAPFILIQGYTTDALSGIKNSDFVKEISENEEYVIDILQKSLTIGKGKEKVSPEIDTQQWYAPADWFGLHDKIYKGVVYIPLTNNVNTAIKGANQSIDYDESISQEEKYQNFEKMSRQRSTDANLLNI